MSSAGALGLTPAVARAGLILPPSVCDRVSAAIDAGHHVALTGAPGTGKTTFAHAIADAAREAMRCTGYVPVTASIDWTPTETVGSLQTGPSGPVFRAGLFLEAIEAGRWVVVDEIDRLDPVRALGPLSTVLSGHAVVLPYRHPDRAGNVSIVPPGVGAPAGTHPVRVPASWRIVATVNGPRSHITGGPPLLSGALARRFAFIEIPSPGEADYRTMLAGPGDAVIALLPIRFEQEIGPAIFLDAARYAARRQLTVAGRSQLLLETFVAYLLPQFAGLENGRAQRVLDRLRPILDRAELTELAGVLARQRAATPGTGAPLTRERGSGPS